MASIPLASLSTMMWKKQADMPAVNAIAVYQMKMLQELSG